MSKKESPKEGQSLLGWFKYHQIIYDDDVKVKLCEWGVECVEDIKLVPINMWTQFIKPNIEFIELSRAEFALKKLQEYNFNVRSNSPLPLNNPTVTKKPQDTIKRNMLHGINLPSIKKLQVSS